MASPSASSDRIWTQYEEVPTFDADNYVRFVVISDTHGTQPSNVPPGDVLLHNGDLTALGDQNEIKKQLEWILSLPHPIKIFIAGNHDFVLDEDQSRKWYSTTGVKLHAKFGYPESNPVEAEEVVKETCRRDTGNMMYLQDEGIEFVVERPAVKHKKWKAFGSPWTPEFGGWAWNYKRGKEANQIHASIPSDTDILLTHGPPYELGNLDVIHDGSHVGCEELARKAMDGEVRPRLWAFGHIHEARGAHYQQYKTPPKITVSSSERSILVNSSIVEMDWALLNSTKTFSYNAINQPIIVDLTVEKSVAGDDGKESNSSAAL
ncbi:unnamed protein product [Sympodiomycopsis kandeliae]